MLFSVMFPVMLILLGAGTLLIGNVPAQEPTGPVPLTTTGEDRAGEALADSETAAGASADAPVDAPAEVPQHAPAAPPAAPAPEAPETQSDTETPPLFFMPVEGVRVAEVADSFGDPRGTDRLHEGIDIMAERGTPVRAAAPGTVRRVTESARGGLSVTIIGDDGLRYFYTHFDSFPEGLAVDQEVGTDTVIGYVGNTGNAAATAPHLHFGVYRPGNDGPWSWEAFDPLPFLIDRSPAGTE